MRNNLHQRDQATPASEPIDELVAVVRETGEPDAEVMFDRYADDGVAVMPLPGGELVDPPEL